MQQSNTNTQQVLVTGGTGKTGKRIAQLLRSQGIPVRIGSRAAVPAFDWENSTTWAAALDGTDAVYISFQPDLAVPGAVETIRRFTAAAVQNGVHHLVLLSGRGEKEAADCEQIVMQAGADWTVLRASWFNQNFSEGNFLDAIREGELALPAGDTPEPFVDVDDIAAVAAAVFTDARHRHHLYELTGPRLLTFADAVQEIARATGRDIRYAQIPATTYTAGMEGYGVPEVYIQLLNYLFTEVLDGRNAYVTDGVQQVLGRPPHDFANYARATAATGVWGMAE
jgi:uncharacterized protein YbjT (DUF2867 family)